MKKRVVSLMLAAMMTVMAVGCGAKSDNGGSAANEGGAADASALVDGKFAETQHITVEVYDRGNDGGSDPVNNKYTDYIKKGMLDKYNVEVYRNNRDLWKHGRYC